MALPSAARRSSSCRSRSSKGPYLPPVVPSDRVDRGDPSYRYINEAVHGHLHLLLAAFVNADRYKFRRRPCAVWLCWLRICVVADAPLQTASSNPARASEQLQIRSADCLCFVLEGEIAHSPRSDRTAILVLWIWHYSRNESSWVCPGQTRAPLGFSPCLQMVSLGGTDEE